MSLIKDQQTSGNRRSIYVYAPSFDEGSGGAVVLHLLVHLLRGQGHPAFIYPYLHCPKPAYSGKYKKIRESFRVRPLTIVLRSYRYLRYLLGTQPKFQYATSLNTPTASAEGLEEAIVVYPESINGNPLNSRRVVRWLLHKPQFINPDAKFSRNELIFYYQEAFKGNFQDLPNERHLKIIWFRNDIYFKSLIPRTKHCCYMLRKGEIYNSNITLPKDAVILDGLSHCEIAKAFSEHKYFACFDPHTMYLVYAAYSGCTPVVLTPPEAKKIKLEDWPTKRPGIASGFDDVKRAEATRNELLEQIENERMEGLKQVARFASIVYRYYD